MNDRANIELLHCDCMDYMAKCKDKEFDLAIVDPPYGLPTDAVHGRGKLKNRIINKDDITKWDIAPDNSYFMLLNFKSKNQIIWGGNYFDLPPTRGIIAWDKLQPWDNFSKWEMAWTSFNKPANIYKFDNRTAGKIHPTQKPVALYKWLLKNYAKPGDRILDTHLGSGSIAIACWDMGLDLVGCEIDKDYYDAAVKRFENHKRQLQLF